MVDVVPEIIISGSSATSSSQLRFGGSSDDELSYSSNPAGSSTLEKGSKELGGVVKVSNRRRSKIFDGLESSAFNSQHSIVDDKLKLKNRVKEFTINKLKYDAVKLVGRENEAERLDQCVTQALSDNKKQLVLIHGISGVGKSTMARSIQARISKEKRNLYVEGKFNIDSTDQPYSGLSSALNKICLSVLNSGDDVEEFKTQLTLELGSDIDLLSLLIPAVATLSTEAELHQERKTKSQDAISVEEEQARWRNAFRKFMKILCSRFSPLVVVLDDLQWCDQSSMSTLESLLSDTTNDGSLIVIAIYRSNEIDSYHPLSVSLTNLADKKDELGLVITEIELSCLQVDDVHQIVMALLAMDDENATRTLAETCFKRTLGNPHFVALFMTMLKEEDLIAFNFGSMQWKWSDKVIQEETMSTENVVDLLHMRMAKLPKDLRLLLQYAACLGSTFRVSVLTLVWREIWGKQRTEKAGDAAEFVTNGLESLERLNFVEKTGEFYRWVHDNIQEAALEMEEAKKDPFHFEIGSILLNNLPEELMEEMLFIVVNLINKSNVQRDFAALNLRAAEKAQRVSAFHSAAFYASRGISLLPDDPWSMNRDLALQLYTIGAEMELVLGNVDIAEGYCRVVLGRDNLSTMDQFPIYMVKIHILCMVEMKYEKAIALCLRVSRGLGCKLIVSKFFIQTHSILSLLEAYDLVDNATKNGFDELLCRDDRIIAIVTVLNRLIHACIFTTKNDSILILAVCKLVKISLIEGLNPMTGSAMVMLGMLALAAFEDVKGATKFTETGLSMQNAFGSDYYLCQTLFSAYGCVLPWNRPLHSCRNEVLESYHSGMRGGNTADALWAYAIYHAAMPMQMGLPLPSIESNIRKHMPKIEELKQRDPVIHTRIYWQFALNMMGMSQDTLVLQGEAFGNEQKSESWTSSHFVFLGMVECQLLVYFGEFERAANLSLKNWREFEKRFQSDPVIPLDYFIRGVALFAMARSTKKRKFKRVAFSILKKIKLWRKKGNMNVRHYESLLSAEKAALKRQNDTATKFYQEAIVYAARTGHLHHAALSNERYADFLLGLGDVQESQYRISEAIRYYEAWGAQAKVELLNNTSATDR